MTPHPSRRDAGYEGLRDSCWSLVLVEGWTQSVPRFIRAAREQVSLRGCPRPPVVVHYCLDTYPDLETIFALDVDGFLTNSAVLLPRLREVAPTALLGLAADPERMRPVPAVDAYRSNVAYLGQHSPTKFELLGLLEALAPLGLAVYGTTVCSTRSLGGRHPATNRRKPYCVCPVCCARVRRWRRGSASAQRAA